MRTGFGDGVAVGLGVGLGVAESCDAVPVFGLGDAPLGICDCCCDSGDEGAEDTRVAVRRPARSLVHEATRPTPRTAKQRNAREKIHSIRHLANLGTDAESDDHRRKHRDIAKNEGLPDIEEALSYLVMVCPMLSRLQWEFPVPQRMPEICMGNQ